MAFLGVGGDCAYREGFIAINGFDTGKINVHVGGCFVSGADGYGCQLYGIYADVIYVENVGDSEIDDVFRILNKFFVGDRHSACRVVGAKVEGEILDFCLSGIDAQTYCLRK